MDRHKKHKPVGVTGLCCGIGRDRTSDTRIFSPLLYLLSYDTFFAAAKVNKKLYLTNILKKIIVTV